MIINRLTTLLGVVFVLSIIIIISFVPRIFALYHQVGGGVLLAETVGIETDGSALPCPAEPLIENARRTQVEEAIHQLQTALRYNPSLANINLLLGRAYCWLGEMKDSVVHYEKYTQMKPNNPLGHLELAFAYQIQLNQFTNTRDTAGLDSIFGKGLQKMAIAELQLTGVTPEQIVESGNYAYSEEAYNSAVVYYSAAASIVADNSIDNSYLFRWGIANIMSGSSELPKSSESSIMVHKLDEPLIIQGEDLQWNRSATNWGINYGDPLNKFSSSDLNNGVMWWEGTAIALIYVDQSGDYQIDLRVQEIHNKTVNFQVERNFAPLDTFTIGGGDQAWYEVKTYTSLNSGFNIIGVNLLKDTGDLLIDRIRISKIN